MLDIISRKQSSNFISKKSTKVRRGALNSDNKAAGLALL